MSRRSRAAAAAVALLVPVGLSSCGPPTDTQLTELNLDRPVDIAFACYGPMRVTKPDPGTGDIVTTAQPTVRCDLLSPQITSATATVPLGQENLSPPYTWYGFILQSASGTVALAEFLAQSSQTFQGSLGTEVVVKDVDPLTPGKNAISVGEDPVAIATDASGCYVITANAGSCDVSVLDVNTAVAASTAADLGNPLPASRIRVDRLPVQNLAGQAIQAKPSAMVAQPGFSQSQVGSVCGKTAGDGPVPAGVMYITYPSCHVVAAVDFSDGLAGRVVGGVQYDANGVPTMLAGDALNNLSCPNECAGAPTTPGVRPGALDLRFDDRVNTERLAIGAANSSKLTIAELDPATSLPTAVSQIQLEDKTGTLGLTAVSMSQQIGMGHDDGIIDNMTGHGGQSQFVYAVATDKSVRVASLQLAGSTTPATECDAEVDTRFAREIKDAGILKCFPVGDPATPPRRAGAHSPGIELLEDSVPTSVTIFQGLPNQLPNTTLSAFTMIGYFAAISTSSGHVFIANIDDDVAKDTFSDADPFASPVLLMAHQLRDGFDDRTAEPTSTSTSTTTATAVCTAVDPDGNVLDGPPRSSTIPARLLPTGTLQSEASAELPSLLQVNCTSPVDAPNGLPVSQLQLAASVAHAPAGRDPTTNVLDETYPDLRNIMSEAWTMTWEGPLSAAANGSSLATVDGPQIRTGQIVVDSFGMKMTDPARPFCEVGAEPFDILQIHGCNPANGDAECPSDYTCYVHPRSKVSGIGSCMRIDEADRFATACYDFLATNRRYTISATSPGELKLVPRKHELYATPVNGCTDDNQCDAIAQYVAVNNVAADPFVVADPNNPKLSHTEWSCQADEQRAPINAVPALNKRCVQTCAFHSTDEALKAAGDPSFDGVDRDADCSAGSICVGATYSPTSDLASRGACMEGVVPPPACVNGPQQYDVRASEAFTVIGSQSGYVHPFVAQGESCVVDPTAAQTPSASRLNIGRIPFKAPACLPPDQVNQITGEVIAQPGTFEPNPCSLTVQQTEYQNNYVAGTCDLDTATPSLLVPREAPAIKFSNRAMTVDLVDPTYPGDKTCIQDRQGPFTDVSLVPPGATPLAIGYQLSFDQKAGFDPMIMPGVSAALPVKLVRGPSESVWILDDGDFLSTTLGVASTSGQVFRIESTNINIVNLLQ